MLLGKVEVFTFIYSSMSGEMFSEKNRSDINMNTKYIGTKHIK